MEIQDKRPIGFASPTLHKGVVYIGSFDQYLYALSAETGRLLWRFRTNSAINGEVIVHDDTIYFGSLDKHLYAISLDGKEKWKFRTGGMVPTVSSVYNNKIYFGSWDCNLYAVSIKTQKLVWKFRTGASETYMPVSFSKILDMISEMSRRVLRLWKPETTAVGQKYSRELAFTDHVTTSSLYGSAKLYATGQPYATDMGQQGKKRKFPFDFP